MKNFKICYIFLLPIFCFILGISMILKPENKIYAEEVSEAGYAKMQIDEMLAFATDGGASVVDSNTIKVNPFTRFGYSGVNGGISGTMVGTGGYENIELTMKVNFTTVGNTYFALRAKDETIKDFSGWQNRGYAFLWFPNGMFTFYKDQTAIIYEQWGLTAQRANDDMTLVFKTVNLSDGSVKVSLHIDGVLKYEYLDSENPILGGGWFTMGSQGSDFVVKGEGFEDNAINLPDMADPFLSGNFLGEFSTDDDPVGTVNATSGINAGVGYAFGASELYSIKTKIKLDSVAGRVSFQIGGSKANAHEANRPNELGDWGWDIDTGYYLYWNSNGQLHLNRNGLLLSSVEIGCTFTAGQTYDVTFGAKQYGDGSVRIFFMLDNTLICSWFDVAKSDYTPLNLSSKGTLPTNLTNYSTIILTSVTGKIIPYEKKQVETKTLSTSEMGQGTNGTFDRNGAPYVNEGFVGTYHSYKDSAIKFKVNFTNFTNGNPSLDILLRSQGTVDTPWGGGWTNLGYQINLYATGSLYVRKNGALICEGPTFAYGFTTGVDYVVEIGTINLNGGVKLYFKIDDTLIFNYLDANNPLDNEGMLSIFSEGMIGKISMLGDAPIITSNAEGNTFKTTEQVTLDYTSANKQEDDEVEYYIDSESTSAQAQLNGNILTASTEGNVAVYVKVNQLYSDNLVLTVEEGVTVTLTNLPTSPLIVGGETHTVELETNGIDEITTKEFIVENVTGKATIDSQTGEITAVGAGTVYVYARVNDIESEKYLIFISPKIEIKNSRALAVGEIRQTLGYVANCDLPDENIITNYELISGSEFALLNTTTGEVKALNYGIITVRVSVIGETFQAVSPITSISIEAPVVTLHNVKDIYVGQTLTLEPRINEGVPVLSKSLEITYGSEFVRVEGDKVVALKEGKFGVKGIVNGYESSEHHIVISELKLTIIAGNMPKNSSQTLSVMFNFDEIEYDNVIYSITKGESLAKIEGDVLTSFDKTGEVTLKAVVDEKFTAYLTINITKEVILVGVANLQQVLLGTKISLSYILPEGVEVQSVKYVIEEGENIVTISKDGQLTAKGIGVAKIRVVVNGISSDTISIIVAVKSNKVFGFIIKWVFIGASIIIFAATSIFLIVRKVRINKRRRYEK